MDPYKKARIKEELGFLKDAGLFIGVIVLPGIGLALLTSFHPSIGGPISAVVLGALLVWGLCEQRRSECERRERDRQLAREFEKAHPTWKVTPR
ncbi:MAG: hypothetical protein IRZ05_21340 [Micromonosporaceae bacterium]|nr:hypothetical protein [Micromonosporaceae bacterium]